MLNLKHQSDSLSSDFIGQNSYQQQMFDGGFSEILAREFKIPLSATQGFIEPSEFIEVAETSDLISKINNLVLDEGLKQLNQWLKCGYKLTLSLNISLTGLTLGALYTKVKSMMQKYPDTKGLVELEITENALITEPKKIGEGLLKIRNLGVSIALDDFGSGFSSLNHLKEIPVDVLKIDRLFTSGIETNSEDQAIVKSIVNLAKELKTETVAEGVETEGQREILKQLNCHCFQGFLVSKPLNSVDLCQQFLKTSESVLPEKGKVIERSSI